METSCSEFGLDNSIMQRRWMATQRIILSVVLWTAEEVVVLVFNSTFSYIIILECWESCLIIIIIILFWLDLASKQALQRFSSPYLSPLLTPSDAPKITSASVSPRGYSAAVSPQRTSGSTSPTIPQFQRRVSVSSFYPSSQQSSAANSPPRARPKPGFQELPFCFPISLYKLCKYYCLSSAVQLYT